MARLSLADLAVGLKRRCVVCNAQDAAAGDVACGECRERTEAFLREGDK